MYPDLVFDTPGLST